MTARVDIYSGVIAGIFVLDCRLRTSPVPVCPALALQFGSRAHWRYLLPTLLCLAALSGRLADVDIMFDGVVYALA